MALEEEQEVCEVPVASSETPCPWQGWIFPRGNKPAEIRWVQESGSASCSTTGGSGMAQGSQLSPWIIKPAGRCFLPSLRCGTGLGSCPFAAGAGRERCPFPPRALPELPAQGQRARPSPGWPGGPCRVAAAAGAAGAWMALPGDREERDPCLGLMLLEEDTERGGSVQALCAPQAVARSHPKPTARSYESLFSFSCPAWSLLYSSVFRAAESAVKEPRIPLDNLGRAGPGCSPSIKPSFSSLSFPVPWHPNWKGCGRDAVP